MTLLRTPISFIGPCGLPDVGADLTDEPLLFNGFLASLPSQPTKGRLHSINVVGQNTVADGACSLDILHFPAAGGGVPVVIDTLDIAVLFAAFPTTIIVPQSVRFGPIDSFGARVTTNEAFEGTFPTTFPLAVNFNAVYDFGVSTDERL